MIKELLLALTSSTLIFSSIQNNNQIQIKGKVVDVDGCKAGTLPTTLDLSLCSDSEIRSYYSSLTSVNENERSGIQALKHLKPILYNMNYFTYDAVGNIYAITDRDWTNSPNLSSGNYDPTTKQVTNFSSSAEATSNPYIRMLYVDYSNGDKTPLKNSKGNANFDKEHVWCQSRGFKAPSGAKGPAGTDLHHLISGDSYVNESIHNNNPYGFVNAKSGEGNLPYTTNNIKGSAKHTSASDESDTVFEPMDCWKGDVARAIFYMMARYNNISGKETISQYEPNLTIANYATSNGNAVESSATSPVAIGILSDLLAWNKIDPVDDFEIYRNDLIYRNYQGNRNPFVDFPQWIDAIWGTADKDGSNYSPTPKGVINAATDPLHGSPLSVSIDSLSTNPNTVTSIKATMKDGSDISWSVGNSDIATIAKTTTVSGEENAITALKLGTTVLTISGSFEGAVYTKEIAIQVVEPKKEEPFNPTPLTIIGGLLVAGLLVGFSAYIHYRRKDSKNTTKSKSKKNSKKRK